MDSPQSILESIKNRRVLVVGDTIVDLNWTCERAKDLDDGTAVYRKLAPPVVSDCISLGGAALVVRNLLELGAKVEFLTGLGWGNGYSHASNFRHPNLVVHAIQTNRQMTVKERFWCDGEKVVQIDQTELKPMSDFEVEQVKDRFDEITNRRTAPPEIIVIADYRHGLIATEELAQHLVARYPNSPPIIVSSQVAQSEANHAWYVGASVFVLNRTEAHAILPQMMDQPDDQYVDELRQRIAASTVIVTCGEEGCLSADELVGGCRTLPVFAVRAVDTCGAGDAFLAAYAVTGMLSFANVWAALSCTVEGANPPRKDMLRGYEGGERDVLGTGRNGLGIPGDDEAHHDAGGDALFS